MTVHPTIDRFINWIEAVFSGPKHKDVPIPVEQQPDPWEDYQEESARGKYEHSLCKEGYQSGGKEDPVQAADYDLDQAELDQPKRKVLKPKPKKGKGRKS